MKQWRDKFSATQRRTALSATFCAAIGLMAFLVSNELIVLGYDLLFLPKFHQRQIPDDLAIIDLDDHSFKQLGQISAPNWDRNLHAQLLDRLTADQARVVVFDIVFLELGTPAANASLARAIRQNGRVVLAAALDTQARAQIQNKQSILPLDVFLDAPVAGWGIAETEARGSIARRYFLGDEMRPSLPWVAATVAGAPITRHPRAQPPDTWLNYYGSALALPHLSFCEVTNYPPGYFRGKSVFVGARPKTLKAMEEADVFQTPHARWGGELFPGVEIGATAYLNLLHDDGLKQIPWPLQCLFIAALGLLLGLRAVRGLAIGVDYDVER